MRLIAKNNTLLLRPSVAPLKRLSRFHSDGETIETAEFGSVKVDATHRSKNTTPGNHIAWGEVLSVGSGAAWMQGRHGLALEPGDIIGFDLAREVGLTFQGEQTAFVSLDAALCRFNASDPLPVPLTFHMLTKEEAGAGERVTFSSAARKFILPRSQAKGTLKVSDSPHSNVKFTVERVVAVGPGGLGHSEIRTERSVHEEIREKAISPDGSLAGSRVVSSRIVEKRQEPVWIQPEPEAIGRLGMFMFTMSIDVYVGETRYRLTNWDKLRCLVDDDESGAESCAAQNGSCRRRGLSTTCTTRFRGGADMAPPKTMRPR